MKYLCLIYQDEAEVEAMSEREAREMVDAVLAYRDELREGGHYIASSPLQTVGSATTIRVRHGQLLMTDGPFAETREQVGGFYLIEARDLNEAIRLVAKMPPARLGSIEVRPLVEIDERLLGIPGV